MNCESLVRMVIVWYEWRLAFRNCNKLVRNTIRSIGWYDERIFYEWR